MIGRSILNVCRPEGVQGALDRLAALRRGHFVQVEHDLRWRKDGSLVHVALRASPLRDGAGVLIGSASITEDISARMHAQEQLSESEERFRGVFERSPIGMALLAGDGSFLRVNSALCDLLGYSAHELANLRCSALSHVGDRQSDTNLHRQLVVGALPGYAIETRFIRKDGTLMWAKKTCSAIRSAAGEFLHAVVIVEDITQRRAAEDQLAFQAHHDALTGLPNRRLLEDRVQQAVAYARRSGGSFAVFYIDLDSFKLVNDSLGHVTGDVLLQDVAARLRNAVRESDTLARTGGDEFVLVATNLRDFKLPHQRAHGLTDQF
jgi:PAS domain S-box-containing protein